MCCTSDVLSLPRPTFPERSSVFRSFTKCTQITYAAVILHVNQARCITSLQRPNAKTLLLTQAVRSGTLELPVNNPGFSVCDRQLPPERTENERLEPSLSPCHPPICHLPTHPIHSSLLISRNAGPETDDPKASRRHAPPFDRGPP